MALKKKEFLARTTDDDGRTAITEGILRVPRGPKKQNISTKMFTRRQNSFIFRIYNVFDMLTT